MCQWRRFLGNRKRLLTLDGVIRPPVQQLRDLCPAVPVRGVSTKQRLLLAGGPRLFANVGVKVVVPALPALLPDPPRQLRGDQRPLLRAVDRDQIANLVILLLLPRPFDLQAGRDHERVRRGAGRRWTCGAGARAAVQRPSGTHQIWVQHLLPAMQALHVRLQWQVQGDLLPIAAPVIADRNPELVVLWSGGEM